MSKDTLEMPKRWDVVCTANYLGISPKALYAAVGKGLVPYQRLGKGRIWFTTEDLEYAERLMRRPAMTAA